jgi:hypothetical protein
MSHGRGDKVGRTSVCCEGCNADHHRPDKEGQAEKCLICGHGAHDFGLLPANVPHFLPACAQQMFSMCLRDLTDGARDLGCAVAQSRSFLFPSSHEGCCTHYSALMNSF